MMRALALLLTLTGCATAAQRELGAVLAPLCVFNCVISVTYAPGVERVGNTVHVDKHDDLVR